MRYDLVVIGGGIHGVGVAQAAAAAGHRCLLLERQTLAHGSSSRSSKLIHGGLRYLESYQFALVRECLKERQRLAKLAPELVRIEPFHIPVYAHTRRRPWLIATGLGLYSLLGGLQTDSRFHRLARREWAGLDGLDEQGLQAVFRYYDGKTDDAALTRAVMASAIELGAELELGADFEAAEVEPDRVSLRYRVNGETRWVETDALVNATGPWVNDCLARMTPSQPSQAIDWVQGAHLVLETHLSAGSYYLEAPQDGRAVFVLPWKGKTLVGTTETAYSGDPEQVAPLAEERDYLREVLGHYFPQLASVQEVEAFAGLRVLPRDETDHFSRPRDTRLHLSHPRVLTLYGGKLTTYRLTADKVMRRLGPQLPPRHRLAKTETLALKPAQ
ncbi:MAG: FAD-dependent oxidoreductase [Gammaproteobacteria bacterium]|nr:FAD-dependent oxidoreductase [Gammaproteobacteria bacterium]